VGSDGGGVADEPAQPGVERAGTEKEGAAASAPGALVRLEGAVLEGDIPGGTGDS